MTTEFEDFYGAERWNRAKVVEAQRSRADANAQRLGWPLTDQNLLSDPLSQTFVNEFERAHSILLPAEYRSFLLQVGDGGYAPGLYMRPLGAPLDDSLPWEPGDIYQDSSDPNSLLAESFPHSDECNLDPSDTDLQTTAGALYLFDQGDAMWDLLVITGKCAGQIWLDRLTDNAGLRPATDLSGKRIGFAQYYCNWLMAA